MDEGAPPPQIGGRYRTIRLLGKGAMGAVYEVEHIHTGQRLALKLLLRAYRTGSEAAERFKREARASSRIKSDHVVRVTDADVAPELDGAPFLVMELLEGADLEKVVTAARPSPPDVLGWLRQIARALDKAHELSIVHRDLKPENLFLTQREDGTPLVKILDFGLAKVAEGDAAQTKSGQLLGTPMYMSPEQADSGSAPISPQSDLYSLGLIAFRLLVGHDFWGPGTIAQTITRILVDPIVSASARGSTLGPSFDAWFARACHRDRSMRFASAYEQVEALAEALDLPMASQPVDSGRRTPLPVGRVSSNEAARTLNASMTSAPSTGTKRGGALAILGILVASGMGVWLWTAPRTPSTPAAEIVTNRVPSSTSAAPPAAETALPALSASSPATSPVADVAPSAPSASTQPPLPVPTASTRPRPKIDAGVRPRDPLEGQN